MAGVLISSNSRRQGVAPKGPGCPFVKAAKMGTSIGDLPEECLSMVLQRASTGKDWLHHALVCKTWTDLSFDAVHCIQTNPCQLIDMTGLPEKLQRFANLLELDATPSGGGIGDDFLAAVAAACPQLMALKLFAPLAGDQGLGVVLNGCVSLRHLDLSFGANFTEEGLGGALKAASQLQTLILNGCEWVGTRTLEAIGASCRQLEVLSLAGSEDGSGCPETPRTRIAERGLRALLEGCPSLRFLSLKPVAGLPDSLGCAKSLEVLRLRGCRKLTALPTSLGELKKLQELDLKNCRALTNLPPSIGNLKSLRKLVAGWCTGLTSLPESISNLLELAELDLSGCRELRSLPSKLGALKSLKSLDLSLCSSVEVLPDTFCQLTSLETLHLSGCFQLTELPRDIGNLSSLRQFNLPSCTGLEVLPESIGQLTSLRSLRASCCSKLRVLPDSIGQLGSLQKLHLYSCTSLQAIPDSVGGLSSLKQLDLGDCKSLAGIPESLGQLRGTMELLSVQGCSSLGRLPVPVLRMPGLRRR